MDPVTILRDLWHDRRFVGGVCVLAVIAGAAVMYKLPTFESRQYDVGVATAQILVDTPSSQVVAVAPKGSDTVGVTANLLATMMIDGPIKSAIAVRAGLQPNQILGATDAAAASAGSAAPPAPPTSPPSPRAFVLTTHVLSNAVGETLPIVEVNTQAPSSAGAANLAAAAVAGLHDYLDSTAALEQVPSANRLQVSGLGTPQVTPEARGPSDAIGLLVITIVFVLGCAGILGVRALVRGWRAASARERLEADESCVGEVRPVQTGFFPDVGKLAERISATVTDPPAPAHHTSVDRPLADKLSWFRSRAPRTTQQVDS
jgi:hypothetical protein